MAIAEIAPKTTRGLMTLWFNICMLSGQMIGVFVVYGCNIHIQSSKLLQYQVPWFVQTFAPAIAITLSFFVVESPRWLALRNRPTEALEALTKLRGISEDHPYLKHEYAEIMAQIEDENMQFGGNNLAAVVKETFCCPIQSPPRAAYHNRICLSSIFRRQLHHKLFANDIWIDRCRGHRSKDILDRLLQFGKAHLLRGGIPDLCRCAGSTQVVTLRHHNPNAMPCIPRWIPKSIHQQQVFGSHRGIGCRYCSHIYPRVRMGDWALYTALSIWCGALAQPHPIIWRSAVAMFPLAFLLCHHQSDS